VKAELYPEEQFALERSAEILKNGIAGLKEEKTPK
jgi:hypothetical protein